MPNRHSFIFLLPRCHSSVNCRQHKPASTPFLPPAPPCFYSPRFYSFFFLLYQLLHLLPASRHFPLRLRPLLLTHRASSWDAALRCQTDSWHSRVGRSWRLRKVRSCLQLNRIGPILTVINSCSWSYLGACVCVCVEWGLWAWCEPSELHLRPLFSRWYPHTHLCCVLLTCVFKTTEVFSAASSSYL